MQVKQSTDTPINEENGKHLGVLIFKNSNFHPLWRPKSTSMHAVLNVTRKSGTCGATYISPRHTLQRSTFDRNSL